MTAVVVDASALVEAVVPENASARAVLDAMSGTHTFHAPALLAWELGQVVHRKLRGRFPGDAARRADIVETLLDGVDLHAPDGRSIRRTGDLGEASGLTFYDAAYLELAERLAGSVLLTEDDRLRAAARESLGRGAMDLAEAAERWTREEI